MKRFDYTYLYTHIVLFPIRNSQTVILIDPADSGYQAYRAVVASSDVTEPPFIEDLNPDNIQVLCGRKFQLRGKYAGEPAPLVKWYRDKTLLSDGKY